MCPSFRTSSSKSNFTGLKNYVVSFAKLFSVFAVESIITAGIVDEVQVMFYVMNQQCGPVSGHSIGEFPIDMQVFLDQYRDHVIRRGSEQITLEEFLQLLVRAQFLDNRAIGYGFRRFYEPWDPNNPDAKTLKDSEKALESAMAAASQKSGPFKMPVIQMEIEVTHSRSADTPPGSSDILNTLQYSAKDAQSQLTKALQQKRLTKVMRIHIYDKQADTNMAATALLRSEDGRSFLSQPSTEYAMKVFGDGSISGDVQSQAKLSNILFQKFKDDPQSGVQMAANFTDAKQVKALVSKLVPTIQYGANGTTVTSAGLSSKNEPLNSTVNMLRTNSLRNSASSNGGGAGGVPLRIIPAQLSMTSLGNPLLYPAQKYFVDFNTGTSIDNLYILTTLTHTLSPGKFDSTFQLAFADAYGVFEGAPNVVDLYKNLDPNIPTIKM